MITWLYICSTLDSQSLDVGYARAVGRGKQAEADVSWGEGIAGKVMPGRKRSFTNPRPPACKSPGCCPISLVCRCLLAGAWAAHWYLSALAAPPIRSSTSAAGRVDLAMASSLLESKALQEARRQLESVQRQMRLQDDFVSTISHELRTPLGFIKGYSTSLLRQDTHWDEKTQHEFLSIIDEETDRLTHLIENMLESARLQSRTVKFKFQPLRLDALVRDVTTRVHAYITPDCRSTWISMSFPPSSAIAYSFRRSLKTCSATPSNTRPVLR